MCCWPIHGERPFHSRSCGTKQVHSTWGVLRCNISKSIPPFGGHPFHPFFLGGTSVPSILFLGGTSVPAFLRLSLTACSAPDPSKSSDTGPGFLLESFSLPQGDFHSSTCLDSWKFIIEVHWTTGQRSIGLSHPCVFFLLWNLLSEDFPGLCKWATAIGPPPARNHPVVHTCLFSSKGPVSWLYFVLVDDGLWFFPVSRPAAPEFLPRLNCFCHYPLVPGCQDLWIHYGTPPNTR